MALLYSDTFAGQEEAINLNLYDDLWVKITAAAGNNLRVFEERANKNPDSTAQVQYIRDVGNVDQAWTFQLYGPSGSSDEVISHMLRADYQGGWPEPNTYWFRFGFGLFICYRISGDGMTYTEITNAGDRPECPLDPDTPVEVTISALDEGADIRIKVVVDGVTIFELLDEDQAANYQHTFIGISTSFSGAIGSFDWNEDNWEVTDGAASGGDAQEGVDNTLPLLAAIVAFDQLNSEFYDRIRTFSAQIVEEVDTYPDADGVYIAAIAFLEDLRLTCQMDSALLMEIAAVLTTLDGFMGVPI